MTKKMKGFVSCDVSWFLDFPTVSCVGWLTATFRNPEWPLKTETKKSSKTSSSATHRGKWGKSQNQLMSFERRLKLRGAVLWVLSPVFVSRKQVFWVVEECNWVNTCRRFEGKCRLCLEGWTDWKPCGWRRYVFWQPNNTEQQQSKDLIREESHSKNLQSLLFRY